MSSRSSFRPPSPHLFLGGTHLLPAKDDQISSIAVSLRDNWNVRYVAPVHCTGEPAFAILKETLSDRYIYAGLGTTVLLGPKVTVKAEAGQPNKTAMDEEEWPRQSCPVSLRSGS
jgi:7,8-dihydropterin-6-yl-methyl-4-(beta-D-ribofuranosyl)aminobenzene 5'-phosphate synthase